MGPTASYESRLRPVEATRWEPATFAEDVMSEVKHTPGPWRWELNEDYKRLHLVGGRPRYDLTIIQPTRWGMGSATLMIRDTAHDGMNLMHKLHERRDWIAPLAGRTHHLTWCADVIHPDMRLIAAAPELLEALVMMEAEKADYMVRNKLGDPAQEHTNRIARAAIARATGQS